MSFREFFSGLAVGFLLGGMFGMAVGTNQTIDLVSAAYGWPREEVVGQVKWYLSPIEEKR